VFGKSGSTGKTNGRRHHAVPIASATQVEESANQIFSLDSSTESGLCFRAMSYQDSNADRSPEFTEEDLVLFGRRVAEQRQTHGWTQREVSHRTGIHSTRLSRIERGTVSPALPELAALGRVYRTGLDALVFGPELRSQEPGSPGEDRPTEAEIRATVERTVDSVRQLLTILIRLAGPPSEGPKP
jgi:transcriptional regulator with XRE-family HTH domain